MRITEQYLTFLLGGQLPASACAGRIIRTYQTRQGLTPEARSARCPTGMQVEYIGGDEHVVYGWVLDGPENDRGFVWRLLGQGDTPDTARGEAWVQYDDNASEAHALVGRVLV